MAALLAELDTFGVFHRDAATSVQKEEVRKAAQRKAQELLTDAEITLLAVVSDVRVPRDGVAQITFHGVDMGTYGTRKEHALRVTASTRIEVKMPRAEALALQPGSRIEVWGRATFRPASDNPMTASLAGVLTQSCSPSRSTLKMCVLFVEFGHGRASEVHGRM